MPFFVNNGLTLRYIALAEHLELADDGACFVVAWSDAARLNHRVHIACDEGSLVANANHHEWCMTRNACGVDVIGCAEISKAVGYEAVLIDFDGTHDVGSVSINNIGTVVYTEVCQLA